MKIKRLYVVAAAILAVCALASSSRAQTTIVSNTFNEANRFYPGIPPYSDEGVVNSEGDIESQFIRGGSGTITVEAPGGGAAVAGSANVLAGNGEGANSASWYTYFTTANNPVTLTNPGDEMILTWQFTPIGVAAINNNQGLTLAVALTPSGGRSAGDGSIPNNVYTGFAMYMNMGTTLSNGGPFQLKRWGLGATSSALLGASSNWSILSNGNAVVQSGTKGAAGYVSGDQYTLTMTMELAAGGNLDVTSTISGTNLVGALNGTGSMSVSYVDTAPTTDGAGLSFDTFDIRPGNTNTTANEFDTSLFEVQEVPEPSTVLLVVAGLGMMIGLARRYRRH